MDKFNHICQADFEVSEDVSETAKDLINKLLVKEAKNRISLDQVLMHPWIESPYEYKAGQAVVHPTLGRGRIRKVKGLMCVLEFFSSTLCVPAPELEWTIEIAPAYSKTKKREEILLKRLENICKSSKNTAGETSKISIESNTTEKAVPHNYRILRSESNFKTGRQGREKTIMPTKKFKAVDASSKGSKKRRPKCEGGEEEKAERTLIKSVSPVKTRVFWGRFFGCGDRN